MRDRRETAWVELAAARITAPILCDAFCLARSDIDNIELSTVSVRAKFGLLKNPSDLDAFHLQAFDDCAEDIIDIKVPLIMNCTEHRCEIMRQ